MKHGSIEREYALNFVDKIVTPVLLVAVLVIVALFLFGCNKNDPKIPSGEIQGVYSGLDEMGIPRHESLFVHKATTAGGTLINSTQPVPAEAQVRLDKAAETIVRTYKAKFPDWQNGFDRGKDFSVLFVEPRVINEFTPPGSPALLTPGGQACGTAIGERRSGWPKMHIVMPHQANQDWQFLDYLETCAYNEWEHVVQSANSLEEYNKHLGPNDVHPHYPPVP